MSETGKRTVTPAPIDVEEINMALAALNESMARMQMGLQARTVFSMAYAGNPDAVRTVFSHLDAERQAKVIKAARSIVAMAEEEPAPVNLADPETW